MSRPGDRVPIPPPTRDSTADLPPEQLASVLRERVYGGLACLSTLLVLAGHLAEVTSPWTAFADVAIGAASLWAASVVADLVGALAAHGGMRRDEVRRSLRASKQILEAATVPLVLLAVSGLGRLELERALNIGIVVSVVTLGLFALLAARRTGLVWWKQAAIVATLLALGAVVTLAKIAAHG